MSNHSLSLTHPSHSQYGANATESSISPDEFERAMAALFPPPIQDGKPTTMRKFKDPEFQRISRLLELFGKLEWSLRPRTYALLRMINEVDAISSFVAEGLYDISIPYSEKRLPDALKGPTVRSKFLKLQPL